MASINIFTHFLQYPDRPAKDKEADRQLLLAASGHFSYLHFVCQEINITFVADLVNLMRVTAEKPPRDNEQLETGWPDLLLSLANFDDVFTMFPGSTDMDLPDLNASGL